MTLCRSALWLTCLILSTAAETAVAEDRFTSPDGEVSFWAPARPSVEEQALPARSGAPFKCITYAVQTPYFMLTVKVIHLRESDAVPLTGHEDHVLEGGLDDVRAKFGDMLVLDSKDGVKDIMLPSPKLRGRQWQGTVFLPQLPKLRIVLREYVAPRSMYFVQVGYPPTSKEGAALAQHVFDSFTVKG